MIQSAEPEDTLCGQPTRYVTGTGSHPLDSSPISHRYPLAASPRIISFSSPGEYALKQEINPSKKRTNGITGIKYVQRSRDHRKGRRKGTNSHAAMGTNNRDSNVNVRRAGASK